MKKLLACVLGVLMLATVAVTPVASTQVIDHENHIILIDDFEAKSLVDLMKETNYMRKGDILKLLTIGPGGDAFWCSAIIDWMDELKGRGVHIITESGPLCASANFFVWMNGDERTTHRFDMLMSHRAYMRGAYGDPIPYESMSPEQQFIIDILNFRFRTLLLDVIHDTELVNDMLDDPENWYTGQEMFDIGVATKILGG